MPRPPFPKTLRQFQADFASEEACQQYLAACRWPDGFICPRCGHRRAYELVNAVEMKWMLRRRHDHPDPSLLIFGFYASVRFESMTISRSRKTPSCVASVPLNSCNACPHGYRTPPPHLPPIPAVVSGNRQPSFHLGKVEAGDVAPSGSGPYPKRQRVLSFPLSRAPSRALSCPAPAGQPCGFSF